MILAPAVRHGTGRPATSMGGEIVDCVNYKTMERLLPAVCKVIMKFTQTPKPEVMDRVKDTLFHSEYKQQNAQEICNIL